MFRLLEEPLQEIMHTHDTHTSTRAAHALWGGVHGICILAITGKLKVVSTEAVEQLINLLIKSYLAGLRIQSAHREKNLTSSNP